MIKCKKRADGRYLAQVQIGYQENGRPKYKNIYGKTRAELDLKVSEFKTNLSKGIIIDDKNLTVSEWADMWLRTYKNGVAHNTYRRYRNILDVQIKPYLGSIKLKNLTLYNIQSTVNELSKSYSISTIKKLSDRSIEQNCISKVLENKGWIDHSICVGNTASIIGKKLGPYNEKLKTLGYIHDIVKAIGNILQY